MAQFSQLPALMKCLATLKISMRMAFLAPFLFFVPFLVLLCAAQCARAAETGSLPPATSLPDLALEDLVNVTVTSVSKKETRLEDSPAAVAVITQEDIRRSGVLSIPEALRMVPGLDVAQVDANKWAISSRGFNGLYANKRLVLIDGRTVYSPVFAGVHWDVQDTVLEDIDRIEVIRGPGASLWGANAECYSRPQRVHDACVGRVWSFRDVTQRKKGEAELEQVHQELLDISHQAGMAEGASSVLHNVGNVLNSVNVSTSLIKGTVEKSRVSSLAKLASLLAEHREDLGQFITHDPRGQELPRFLVRLSEHLSSEKTALVQELDSLRGHIEHIKQIVAVQQSYAKVLGLKEVINVGDLVEDSLRMDLLSLDHHGVELVRDIQDVPPVNLEKHKILQILVNLVRNAKRACADSGRTDKQIVVQVANGNGTIKISVHDNGVGIPPENMTRIFSHGFTTRKDGHGFGLHSGALAAREMGGSLTVHSDGTGRGARFTLELPCSAPSHDS